MKGRQLAGILLIAVGIIFLFNQTLRLDIFTMSYTWPIFVLGPGLLMEYSYFSTKKNPGILVPGGILTVIGLLFFFETYTNWRFADSTWPIYPLAVAIGLFQHYLFSGKEKGLLIPVFILTAVSVISFAFIFFGRILTWSALTTLLAVILIAIGLRLLFKK